jgi:hypothetical protein
MAHQSSWSQGEGSRRWPGRPGGARKRKVPEWEHQAVHKVETLADLPQPVTTLFYRKPWGKNPSESIYLFDQQAAKAGIDYYAEYGQAASSRWFLFHIWVNEANREATQRIIDQLNPEYKPKRTATVSGRWSEIEPTRLAKTHKDHPWVFADYRESSSERGDGLNYVAFLFRDQDRKIFGIKEWLGKDVLVRNDVLEKMAHRVVVDSKYRKSLVSDDPDLPVLWKKH